MFVWLGKGGGGGRWSVAGYREVRWKGLTEVKDGGLWYNTGCYLFVWWAKMGMGLEWAACVRDRWAWFWVEIITMVRFGLIEI